LHLAYLTVRGLLRGIDYEPSLVLPQLSLEDIANPAEAARHVRRLWRIPTGPIRDLTEYLEAAGLFLVPCNAPGKVDAVTRRCEEGWHVTAYNRDMPPDRDRLTRAHELAHLVLHYNYFGPDVEAEADEFAAELLTPADEIGPQLTGLTTRDLWKLMDLRLHWKVSVPFLVQRAYELDCISDRQRRSFYQALSSRGMMYRTVDDQLPVETPMLLRRVISVHLNDHGYSLDSLAGVSLMTTARFQRHFSTVPSRQPKLSVVKTSRP
jgi:Zn-dependent peptidase ImmA (M78 family)